MDGLCCCGMVLSGGARRLWRWSIGAGVFVWKALGGRLWILGVWVLHEVLGASV